MLHQRKKLRLSHTDYSADGVYFITSCCKNRIHHFGNIKNGKMFFTKAGEIAQQQFIWLENQYSYLIIHNVVIMPNHIHVLLEIDRSKANGDCKIKSVSSLMGAYKTTSSKLIHLSGNLEFEWQRSFHDHIVRNQQSYENIYQYITDNPIKWGEKP